MKGSSEFLTENGGLFLCSTCWSFIEGDLVISFENKGCFGRALNMKVKVLFIFTFNSERIKNQYRYEADTHCSQALAFFNATQKYTHKRELLQKNLVHRHL